MAINQLKGLPLGTSDFIALRMADEIYVDKTEMVFSLAVNRGKYFLASDFSQVCERSSQWCELRYSQVQTAH